MDIPIRQDITVLDADDPNKQKIGFVCYENTGPFYLPSDDDSCYATDKADEYFSSWGKEPSERKIVVWAVIPQLEFLWGQPWNNLALSYVTALRPSKIRVSTGNLTLDALTWRVTVILEKDNRTIKRIEQECDVNAIGANCGQDLKLKLKQQITGKKIPQFDASCAMVNVDALKKINFGEKSEKSKNLF